MQWVFFLRSYYTKRAQASTHVFRRGVPTLGWNGVVDSRKQVMLTLITRA